MATHVYRFRVQNVPMPSGLGGAYTPTEIPLMVYTDISADDTQLTDLESALATQGVLLATVDPAPPDALTDTQAAFWANAKLIKTAAYTGRGTVFTSAVRAFGTVNNGTEVYNAGAAGFAFTKLRSTLNTRLEIRLTISGTNSVAGTTANAIKARIGYTTSNTAGTAFTASSYESGTIQTTATANGAWTSTISYTLAGTDVTYYFYISVIALTSGTASIPAASGTTGGVSLIVQEIGN
jgi:hypothetical protein